MPATRAEPEARSRIRKRATIIVTLATPIRTSAEAKIESPLSWLSAAVTAVIPGKTLKLPISGLAEKRWPVRCTSQTPRQEANSSCRVNPSGLCRTLTR